MSLLDQLLETRKVYLQPSGGCHNCPRRRVDFVPSTHPPGARLLWLGEAPGETEVEQQEGFVGKSGQYLRTAARECAVPGPWAFSNVVHCRPPDNATPGAREVQCCLSQYTLGEVRNYPWVVMVGNVAVSALFPGAHADRFRGNVSHHPDFPGQRFYATYHPAYILRRPSVKDEFLQQLQRLGSLVRGDTSVPWKIVRAGDAEFVEAFSEICEAPLVSWDIETTQLESWLPGAKITSMAFTADARTVVYVQADEPQFRGVARRWQAYLEDQEKHVLGANIGFDLVYFEEEVGCRHLAHVHDVSTLYYEMGRYKQPSLKLLAAREGDGYRFLLHHGFPVPELEPWYNAEDCVQALLLYRKGMRAAAPATKDLVVRTSSPTGYMLRRISQHGFYVRQDYRQQQIEEYSKRRVEAVEAWKAADPQFIPEVHESGKGLAEYLFAIKSLPILQTTETGEPSVERTIIRRLIQGGAPYLQHLLTIREIDKVESTFLTPYDGHIGTDSRVHSQYTNTWSDTGRPSSRAPNLQNIPKRPGVRDLFGVPPGSLLGDSDLSQIEFRIMVSLAKDENGIAGYLRGDDAHLMTASTFAANPTKADRTIAKPVNFGMLYGGGPAVIQRTALEWYGQDWEWKRCQDFALGFMRLYPRIPEFHRACQEKLVRNRGWFESVTGHCFHYQGWDAKDQGAREHAVRSAVNSEAQGPAAQICFHIMGQAHYLFVRRKLPARFVNTVHDSILWELSEPARLNDVLEAMEEARTLAYEWVRAWFLVPLVIEHEVGERWGSLAPVTLAGATI